MQENSQVRTLQQPQRQLSTKINHNGFTNTPPATQVAPPVLVILAFILTLVQIHGEEFDLIVEGLLDGMLCGLLLAACVLWYQATKIIPTDTIQLKHLDAIEKGEIFDSSVSASFCQICQTHIGRVSYHCKKCQRCVEFFDHHCKWLNNCIGAKNYFEFYGLLLVSFSLLSICIGINGYAFTLDNGEYGQKFIIAVIVVSLLGIPSVWLIYLISLHTYLIVAKRSTIQLILQSRKKSKASAVNPIKCNVEISKIVKLQKTSHVVFKEEVISQDVPYEQAQNQTNHVLIRPKNQGKQRAEANSTASPSIKESKSLPPIKLKVLGHGVIVQVRKNQHANPIFNQST